LRIGYSRHWGLIAATITWPPGAVKRGKSTPGAKTPYLLRPHGRTSFARDHTLPEHFMFVLTPRAEWIAAIALAILMAVTRIHHFGVGNVAPDGSTGVFFLAGLLLASPWWIAVFVVEAVILDGIAIGFLSVADACMSSGYALLAPAYAALWFAGRALRKTETLGLPAAAKFVCFVSGGTILFFIISNLGYFLGSDFYELGFAEYVTRVSRYFPTYLTVTFFYSALGVAAYFAARASGMLEAAAAR
jgi:hypothetical protein